MMPLEQALTKEPLPGGLHLDQSPRIANGGFQNFINLDAIHRHEPVELVEGYASHICLVTVINIYLFR